MDVYSGNKNVTSDFNRMALKIKEKALQDCHCVEVAQVMSTTNGQYQCRTISQQFMFVAMAMQGLTISVGDVVIVVFADTDFRVNLKNVQNSMAISPMESTYHSMSYGIIIGKL